MEREGEFGNEEPELSNVLGMNPVQGVGGGEREGRLEGSGEGSRSGVGVQDGQKERPVFAVINKGVAGGVKGVECEAMSRSICEVGEDVNPHPVLSKGRNRPEKLGFYFDYPVSVECFLSCQGEGCSSDLYGMGEQ